MNSFYIKTLGCKVNQCDAQEIRERFLAGGWQEVGSVSEASVCVVNTCCVTDQADRKSRSAIRQSLAGTRKGVRVVVAGCYPGYDRFAVSLTGVEAVFSVEQRPGLFKWIDRVVASDHIVPQKSSVRFGSRTRAFLKVQEGCDYRCRYCVVPLVRGRSRSLPFEECLARVQKLVAAGHREIVVTGVSLGAFGRDLRPVKSFTDLLAALEEVPGVERIRISSIEPMDITDDLIKKVAASSKICRHFHIPFQSGDDAVLRHMGRRMTVKGYKGLVHRIRRAMRDVGITCDIIVGYPMETDRSVKNTLSFLRYVRPLRTHLFTFSLRRGTDLYQAGIAPLGPDEVRRFSGLYGSLADTLAKEEQKRSVGRTAEVLFEQKKGGLWHGYAANYQRVSVEAVQDLRNRIFSVRVSGVKDGFLMGKLCGAKR